MHRSDVRTIESSIWRSTRRLRRHEDSRLGDTGASLDGTIGTAMSRNFSDTGQRQTREEDTTKPNDNRRRSKSHSTDKDAAAAEANVAGPRALSSGGGGSVLRERLELGSESTGRAATKQRVVSTSRSQLAQLRPKRKQASPRLISTDRSGDSSTTKTAVSLAATARILVRCWRKLHIVRALCSNLSFEMDHFMYLYRSEKRGHRMPTTVLYPSRLRSVTPVLVFAPLKLVRTAVDTF